MGWEVSSEAHAPQICAGSNPRWVINSAQIGDNDEVPLSEVKGDLPPHKVRLRETVQQHYGGAFPRVGDVDGHAVRPARP